MTVGASLEAPFPGTDPGESIHEFVRLRVDYRRMGDRHPYERRACVDAFFGPCYTVEEVSEVTISYWALVRCSGSRSGITCSPTAPRPRFVTVERVPGGASRGNRGTTVFGELRAPGLFYVFHEV